MLFIKKLIFLILMPKKINDISYMFFNCFSLGKNYFLKIEINKIITKNMFFGCDN